LNSSSDPDFSNHIYEANQSTEHANSDDIDADVDDVLSSPHHMSLADMFDLDRFVSQADRKHQV
jgi:hypothetical protein